MSEFEQSICSDVRFSHIFNFILAYAKSGIANYDPALYCIVCVGDYIGLVHRISQIIVDDHPETNRSFLRLGDTGHTFARAVVYYFLWITKPRYNT